MPRLLDWLPRGHRLPPEVWASRHRGLLGVLAAHLCLLPAFAATQGWSLATAWLFDLAPAVFGAAAASSALSRSARSSLCAMALLTCSAMLVVAWHGTTEAHFSYFVMVGALALYEEWWAYLLAIAFVVVQHGAMGAMQSEMVFHHAHHAWRWSVIHGAFVAGLALTNLISWRANERVRAATASSEERFRRAFDDAPVAMALVAPDGRLLQTNHELLRRTGHRSPEGLRFWDLVPADDRPGLAASWPPSPEGSDTEGRYLRADGSVGWILWRHSLLLGEGGRADHYVSQGVDITARKRDQQRLDHQAHHDPLTGLPNRARFDELLETALVEAHARGQTLAVLFCDIDNFKVINDSLGHRTGDELLVAVAGRLAGALRPADTIARFGGDEFVVLLERVEDLGHARRVADRLAAELRRPVTLDGQQRFVSASVGIALAEAGARADDLLRDADAAMYQAKAHGKARSEVFDESLRVQAVERLELEAGLREAVARAELELHYQPVVSLEGEVVVGAEALLRWRHRTLGLIRPDRFIPIAEQSGLIVPIGEWVLATACNQAAEWHAAGWSDLVISVNLSPRQLSSPDLAFAVSRALTHSGLAPSALCLEITESAIMEDPEAAHAILQGLKALGVRLAIDDFGVGYSSLSHLKYLLPVDVIKIDKSFTDGLLESRDSRAIVTAVVRLAHALEVLAVAEGVETAEQAGALRELGCHIAQGFHYFRPQPAADLAYLFSQSESFSAASETLSPVLLTPSPTSRKIVLNRSE